MQEQNRYLDYITDPSFPGVKKLFVLSFKNNSGWASYKRYYLPWVEINNDNIMVDE